MKLSARAVQPCTFQADTRHVAFKCCTITQPPRFTKKLMVSQSPKNWEGLLDPVDYYSASSKFAVQPIKISKRWMEYQGSKNWDGLLDPLDDNLRSEILRYGEFVDAAYKAFDFDSSSPSYGTCRFLKNSLLDQTGIPQTGYRLTKNLRATSGIQLPRWMEKAPSWMSTQSSWIGYVAVCQNKEEIARLGRRDVVIALRGTATCMEWLENLRATLTHLPNAAADECCESDGADADGCGTMVESGFLSLYTCGTTNWPSLQQMVRQEIARLLQSYGDEPLSLTITGHSLGAALATLAAYDIKTTFKRAPLVTVISFGGPRVGNRSFRYQLEKQGTKILRIVNSDDLITKVPGFVIDDDDDMAEVHMAGLPSWIQKHVEDTPWVYAEVGKELRLSSRKSPYINSINVATCHELKTYLHLVEGFVSSTCPFKATAKRLHNSCKDQKFRVPTFSHIALDKSLGFR